MTVRKVFFWLHLTAGVTAGIVVFIMSVTGVLLAFERQITEWADGIRVERPAGAERLSVATLLARVRATHPDAIPSSVTVRADPAAPVAVGLGRGRTVFVDPFRGEVLGEGSKKTRNFFGAVTEWHRWLGAQGESRAVARAVTGASNLAFLFLVTSGFYLWWPRQWSRPLLRSVTFFVGGLRGRARDFNWHNVIGFWSAVPLFFIVLSGAVISYPWASDLVYRLTGNEPPPRQAPGAPGAPRGERPASREGRAPALDLEGLDERWARAEAQVPGWQSITLRLPGSADAPLTFSIDESTGAARPDKRAQLTLDRKTGEVVRFEPYSSQNLGRRLRTWLRWIHTGEAGGFVGQGIAGLASGGAAVLVWTGLALAWRRFRAWLGRRAAVTAASLPAPRPLPEGTTSGEA